MATYSNMLSKQTPLLFEPMLKKPSLVFGIHRPGILVARKFSYPSNESGYKYPHNFNRHNHNNNHNKNHKDNSHQGDARFGGKFLGITTLLGVPISMFRNAIYCDDRKLPIPDPEAARLSTPPPANTSSPPTPESKVSIAELGFGSIAGICVGVFVKKGLRTVAFLFGGVFVFLQYLVSRNFVNKVNWGDISQHYDTVVDRLAGPGKQSRLSRVYHRFVDFLLADFPSRATFLAGFALGLRIG